MPQPRRFLITILEQHDPLAGTLLELFGVLELGVGCLVKAIQVPLRKAISCNILTEVDQMLDQHAEWSAPVADVVFTKDVVTEEDVHSHKGITDHR